jgi:hypothetical protein
MQAKPEFVRQEVGRNGLIYLFCAACGKPVAYSPRPEVLCIAESAHRKNCPAMKQHSGSPAEC